MTEVEYLAEIEAIISKVTKQLSLKLQKLVTDYGIIPTLEILATISHVAISESELVAAVRTHTNNLFFFDLDE